MIRKVDEKLRSATKTLLNYNGLALILYGTALIYGLAYRARVYYHFAADEGTVPSRLYPLLGHLDQELLYSASVFLLALIAYSFIAVFRPEKNRRLVRIVSLGLIQFYLIVVAFLYSTHYELAFSLRSGLRWEMIVEAFNGNMLLSGLGTGNIADYLFILLIFALFWGLLATPLRRVPLRNMFLLGISIFSALLALLQNTDAGGRLQAVEIRRNPVFYTMYDIGRFAGRKSPLEKLPPPPAEQMRSVAFIHPNFVHPDFARPNFRNQMFSQNVSHKRNSFPKKWNIVFVIMESTGAEYVFSRKYGNSMPMPFLHKIAAQSLHAVNHHSPANTTPRSQFSIYSGLFPAPRIKMFATRRDVRIPSILQFLGKDYNSVLVNNGSKTWYVPRGFLENNGIEILTPAEIHLPVWKRGPSNGRNESQMFDYFLKKIRDTPEPFLGMYHSYIAHWPYFDYGRKYNVFGKKRKGVHRWVYRYYNNLNLMDALIQRLFRELKKTERLRNTIIVITGDHGQAFGKHRGNWIHSRASYKENYAVPLVIYQPRLFPAEKIRRRTMHTDILPTLLQRIGIPYNHNLMQGENMALSRYRRKYDFFYGNERNVLSIDRSSEMKLQVSMKTGKCRVWDLRKDPDEMHSFSCKDQGQQKRALLSYVKLQNHLLDSYNRSLKKGLDFHGQSHPFQNGIGSERLPLTR